MAAFQYLHSTNTCVLQSDATVSNINSWVCRSVNTKQVDFLPGKGYISRPEGKNAVDSRPKMPPPAILQIKSRWHI